jgi:FK506-binding protein 4/5
MTANSDIQSEEQSSASSNASTKTTTTQLPLSGDDISPKKDGGVLKTVIRAGPTNEHPVDGETVYVHYVGTLFSDGSKFDSSRDRNEKFSFTLGRDVIKGWDIAVATMSIGECSRFIIKSDYGYGPVGSPPTIPPNATLVFEIELFDFHGDDISEAKDKSILRSILKQGEGYTTPNDGASCVINVKGTNLKTNQVFDSRQNVQFEIGEGASLNIVEGIEYGLTKFKKSEISKLVIKSSRAWGSDGFAQFNIEPFTDVSYEVELVSFEKAKETWQLNSKEKLEQSRLVKDRGSEMFKVFLFLFFIF